MRNDGFSVSQAKHCVAGSALDEDGGADGDFVGDGLAVFGVDPLIVGSEEIGGKSCKIAILDPDFICLCGIMAFLEIICEAEVLEECGGGIGSGDEVEVMLDDRAGGAGLDLAGLGDLNDDRALALHDESVWVNEGKVSDGLAGGGIHTSGAFGSAEDEAAPKVAKSGALGDEDVVRCLRVWTLAQTAGAGVKNRVERGGLAEGEVVTHLDACGGNIV